MFHPLSLAIGLRFLRSKKSSGFVSFISVISIVGIMLGTMSLIVVLSVMNGFQTEIKEKLLGNTSHGTLYSTEGSMDDKQWHETVALANQNPEVIASAPFIESHAMVMSGGMVKPVLARGIDPVLEVEVTKIGQQVVDGDLQSLQGGSFNVAIGQKLANSLLLGVGDKLTLVAPEANVNPLGVTPRNKRFTISAIFDSGLVMFDQGVILTHYADLAVLIKKPGQVDGVRVNLSDMMMARAVINQISERSDSTLYGSDWTRQNQGYFNAVRTERTIMFIILTMIVAVASFNIVSTLVMVVNDKQSDIAIMRTVGASPGMIMRIFLVQGTFIGFVGTMLGVFFGVLIALNVGDIVSAVEGLFGQRIFDPAIYGISELPTDLRPFDVLTVALTGFSLSVVATLYPAWSAARTEPAEALRYE